MMKYIIISMICLCSMLASISLYAWVSVPLPPQRARDISTGKSAGTSKVNHPTLPAEEIKYRSYRPGQIKLDRERLRAFNLELKHAGISSKYNRQIEKLIIIGYSDKMTIDNHLKIWNDIPISIRPSSHNLVDNKMIAQARAEFIIEYTEDILGYRLPVDTVVQSVSDLEISKKNRGIDVIFIYIPSFGVSKPPTRIKKLP